LSVKSSGIFAGLTSFSLCKALPVSYLPVSLSLNSSSVKSSISRVQCLSETCALFLTRLCQGSLPFGFCARINCDTPDRGCHPGSVRPPCGLLFFMRVSSCHVAACELNRRGPMVTSPLTPSPINGECVPLRLFPRIRLLPSASSLSPTATSSPPVAARALLPTNLRCRSHCAEDLLRGEIHRCFFAAAASGFLRRVSPFSIASLRRRSRARRCSGDLLPEHLRRLRLGPIHICLFLLCSSDLGLVGVFIFLFCCFSSYS
jgi:hypothetical protein